MSDELSNYLLTIDTKKAHEELDEVERHRTEEEIATMKAIKKIEQESRKVFFEAVTMMQRTWYTTETIFRALGFTFPAIMREIVGGVFGAIAAVKPLLLAESVTGIMTAQAIFGLTQIGFSIAAAFAAQQEQKESQAVFNDINSVIGAVSSYIGSFSF